MGGGLVPLRGSEMGGAQVLQLFSAAGGQNISGTGPGGGLATADATTLTTAMQADVQAQLVSVPVQSIINGWPQGNP
jgi:hypothetical protein